MSRQMRSQTVLIITPAFNAARFLAETVSSVISQKHEDWKLIVVDDGSTDDTYEVAARFQSDSRISVVQQENSGVSSARNHGLKYLDESIKYLVFLDADDLLLPCFLRSSIDHLTQNPEAGVSLSKMKRISSDGKIISENPVGKLFTAHLRRPWQELSNEVLLKLMLLGFTTPPCRLMFRSDLSEIGKGFDTSLHGTEDSDLLIRLASDRVIFSEFETLGCYYRLHRGAATGNSARMLENWMRLLDKQARLIPAVFSPESELCRAARSIVFLKTARKEAKFKCSSKVSAYLDGAIAEMKAAPEDTLIRTALENVSIKVPDAGPYLEFIGARKAVKLVNKVFSLKCRLN